MKSIVGLIWTLCATTLIGVAHGQVLTTNSTRIITGVPRTRRQHAVTRRPRVTARGTRAATGTRSTRTTTLTVAAVVESVDATGRNVHLRLTPDGTPSSTPEIVVAVQDTVCQPRKNNRAATLADFAPGEQVIARLTWRTTPEPVVILRDLYDAASYTEREQDGKTTCVGTVETFTATQLSVRRGDGMTTNFRIGERTLVIKNDAYASIASFPVGASVAVKPRRLPGGDLQASIVGGTAEEVAWAYRDTLSSWSGTVSGVQGDERSGATVTLRREDGAARRFLLPTGALFEQGRALLPWQYLNGAAVTVHLVKGSGADGMRYADMVKIASRRTRRSPGLPTYPATTQLP